MSKITQALNKAQQQFSKSSDAAKETEKEPSLFLTAIDAELKDPTVLEIFLTRLIKYKWFLIAGTAAACFFIFLFGVSQGIKIEQSFGENPAPVPAASQNPVKVSALTVDDAGQPVALTSDDTGTYTIISETPETVPAAEVETPVPTGRYTLQLITYTSRARAQEEVNELQENGFYAFIVPTEKHFQVCVHRFEKAADARKYLDELSRNGGLKRYPGAFIRVVKNL